MLKTVKAGTETKSPETFPTKDDLMKKRCLKQTASLVMTALDTPLLGASAARSTTIYDVGILTNSSPQVVNWLTPATARTFDISGDNKYSDYFRDQYAGASGSPRRCRSCGSRPRFLQARRLELQNEVRRMSHRAIFLISIIANIYSAESTQLKVQTDHFVYAGNQATGSQTTKTTNNKKHEKLQKNS